MDILTDILRAQRLRGTVYFRADFRQPWGLDIQGGEFANFHIVARGRCWMRTRDAEGVRVLEEGDVVMFPHGGAHALLHAPDATAVPASQLLDGGGATAPDDTGCRVFGGGGAVTTTLICGHFEYDRRFPHPLFESLPPTMHVSAARHGRAAWMATAGQLASAESALQGPGVSVIVDRLAEALLVQALLAYVDEMPQLEVRSFLAAIQDRSIGRVLEMMHHDINREWTLSELAQAACVSRSVFVERFRAMVGDSPMVYLACWRMLKARELLLDTSWSVAQVADAVGYKSEFAFAKAFKRRFQLAPGAMRRPS